jgi:fatty-acyl-CoA synthase
MQDAPLLISDMLLHGASVYATSKVFTVDDDGYRTATFAEVAERAAQLAHGLTEIGIERGDRVGTFLWNNQTHLEAYLGIPSMGAVLHTLNIRLPHEDLVYVINHAADRMIIIDDVLIPLLLPVLDQLETVERIIVAGPGDASALGDHLRYDELLADQPTRFDWPVLDEKDAAAMCYTSGTTGRPKGVVYSHRSTYLHTLAQTSANSVGLCEADRILVIVPMFHANGWGTPYAGWFTGADLVMPQHHLMGASLAKIIPELRPTVAVGVPTIWNDLLQVGQTASIDTSSLRGVLAGGAAVPRSLIEAYEEQFGLEVVQGWGMTETSPLAALANPPARSDPAEAMDYRVKAGRVVAGVKIRVVAEDGSVLPNDGVAVGEFEVAGPWVTGSYYLDDDPEKFRDGWLRTGDVGTLDAEGFMTISDRTKDVIKSGGEWISSVELEGEVMANPKVFEAAVIAVDDPQWTERPLVCVVAKPGEEPTADELVDFLSDRVPRWWLPERWSFVESIPKTSVGKFDKKLLRARFAQGLLEIVTVDPTTRP